MEIFRTNKEWVRSLLIEFVWLCCNLWTYHLGRFVNISFDVARTGPVGGDSSDNSDNSDSGDSRTVEVCLETKKNTFVLSF
jgi:hypothetical protein